MNTEIRTGLHLVDPKLFAKMAGLLSQAALSCRSGEYLNGASIDCVRKRFLGIPYGHGYNPSFRLEWLPLDGDWASYVQFGVSLHGTDMSVYLRKTQIVEGRLTSIHNLANVSYQTDSEQVIFIGETPAGDFPSRVQATEVVINSNLILDSIVRQTLIPMINWTVDGLKD